MSHVRKTPLCRHCWKRAASSRGLCKVCFADLSIRDSYPVDTERAKRFGGKGGTEPSADEVERIVAEQMNCLPPWWDEECRRLAEHDAAD